MTKRSRVARKVNFFNTCSYPTEYHVDNGCLLEAPVPNNKFEKMQILASHGSVIKITRDATIPEAQNKYSIDPANLAMEATAVQVDSW